MAAASLRIGKTKDLRLAWRYGGRRERQLVTLVLAAPLAVAAAFIVANIYLILAVKADGILFITNLVIIMPAASWPFYQPAITTPMYSNGYYLEAIRQGWLSPTQCKWAAEIVRFREARGVAGQIPGNVQRGIAYGGFYYTVVVGSVPFSLALYPILGGWTWVAFAIWYLPVAVVLWRIFWRRMKREADLAAREGFRMREYAAEMMLELQQARTRLPKRS